MTTTSADHSHTITATPGDSWCVYMILSSDQRLYTGITNNLSKRWQAHSGGANGAKFFRGRKPEKLVYVEAQPDRSRASQREAAIKKLTRARKLQLIAEQTQDWHTLLALPT